MTKVSVHKIPGQMPPVWERDVVFVANLLALFYGNDSETDVLRAEVGALETYGGRLIPLLNLLFNSSNNCLVLEKEPDRALLDYFQDELKLVLPEIKVMPHEQYTSILLNGKDEYSQELGFLLQYLSDHPSSWIDGYVTDPTIFKIGQLTNKNTVSSVEGSRNGNNKYLLHKYLESQGLPVFDTCMAENQTQVEECLKTLKEKGYTKAVIKAQIGASGIGMKKVNIENDIECQVSDYLFFEGPCLVQGWLDESLPGMKCIGSPSVQMFLGDTHVSLYDITEQILNEDSVHEGNIAPPPYLGDQPRLENTLLSQAEVAGRWLHEQGYRGTASVDLLVIEREREVQVFICEINARVTGATYPSMIARHFLPKDAWLLRNIRFNPPLDDTAVLDTLDREGLLFRPGKREGVIPINLNPNSEGKIVKGQFLFLGPKNENTIRLIHAVNDIPSMKGDYDRD